jgi:hypothetical protein
MAGYVSGKVSFCNLEYTWQCKKPIDMEVYTLVHETAV